MRLSELQLHKISAYLLDISKLLVGATIVSLFVPGNIVNVSIPSFVIGTCFAILSFVGGLTLLKQKNEQK